MNKLRIGGYKVNNVDFSSGQEPDGVDQEFATTFDVGFNIDDRELARLLGVQERVLETRMKKMDTKTLLKLLANNNKIQRELEALVRRFVNREFHGYFINELSNSGWVAFNIEEVELESDNISDWSAVISPNKKGVKFSVTFSVLGSFEE